VFRLEVLARVGDEVAAVADHHRVLVEQPGKLAIDTQRMNGVGARGQQRAVGGHRPGAGGLEPGQPRLTPGGRGPPGPAAPSLRLSQPPRDRAGELGEERRQVAGGGGGERAMGGDLVRGVGHVHDLRGGAPSWPPNSP
jgi:hypothetical protein